MKTRPVRIMIIRQIPVFEHLKPRLGRTYRALECVGERRFFVVDMAGKPVVVRQGEAVTMGL